VLAGPIGERWPPNATIAVAVGFLGAFTTFSTFTFETTALLRDSRPLAALLYVGASVLLGLAASAIGYVIGRAVM
jgi:CrcB protein